MNPERVEKLFRKHSQPMPGASAIIPVMGINASKAFAEDLRNEIFEEVADIFQATINGSPDSIDGKTLLRNLLVALRTAKQGQ